MADASNPPAAGLAATLVARGLRISIAGLGGRGGYQRLARTLTVTEKVQPGRPKTYARACRTAYFTDPQDPGFVYVPRVKAPALLGTALKATHAPAFAEACRVGGGVRAVPAARWRPAQRLYAYQEAAANYLCSAAGPFGAAGAAGVAYVQMGTGMGKTRFSMAVAARGRGPVFVVVPTEAIRLQWMDEFAKVFPELSVAAYANPPKNGKRAAPSPATHDVVIGIVNTVRAKTAGFFAGYATVVLDEAHELSSPHGVRVLWLAQEAPRVLGLSATPSERLDGLDRVVFHFLGRPIRAETDIPGFDTVGVNFLGRVREVEYEGSPEYCETVLSAAGTVSAIGTIGNLIRDPARLRLVAAEVERLFSLHETEPPASLAAFGLGLRPAAAATPGHPEGAPRMHGVFVFAEHREYLPALRDALCERFAPEDIEAPELGSAAAGTVPVVLRGGATRAEIHSAHRARIVLTTYGYSRRGVSIVEMTAIVLATPRRSGLRQILGRITRRGSDESILRLVVDIKDVCTALRGQNADRRKVYKEKLYPIYRVRVNHADFSKNRTAARPTGDEELAWEPPLSSGGPEEANGPAAPRVSLQAKPQQAAAEARI